MSEQTCTQCLNTEFYTNKAQEYAEQGIPVTISKPILKILFEELAACGLNCCENEIDFEGGVTYYDENTSLGDGAQEIRFVGNGVSVTRLGDIIYVNITGSGTGLEPGNYGDITVSSNGLSFSWIINNGSVTLPKLQNISTNKVLGRATSGTGQVEILSLGSGLITNTPGTIPTLNTNVVGENLGVAGEGVYFGSTGSILKFKKLIAGSNVTLTTTGDNITISSIDTQGNSGEDNTASNVGTGEGVFKQKVGVDLQFKSLKAGPNVTLTSSANEITIDSIGVASGQSALQFKDEDINLGSTGTVQIVDFTGDGIQASRVGNTVTVHVDPVTLSPISLNDLTDATISSPVVSQVLKYNGTQWVNATDTGGPSTNAWGLEGNSGTNPSINFIGTTDNQDLIFKRDNTQVGRLTSIVAAFGKEAGKNSTMGLTALGEEALTSNITGTGNTALGRFALKTNTTGNFNTANGHSALYSNTSGNENTTNGSSSLYSNTTGNNNTANGHNALFNNTIGNYNTANSNDALYHNTTGNENTANGFSALYSNIDGSHNTANGNNALYSNITGSNNTAVGRNADVLTPNQTYSTAIGSGALVSTNNTVKLGRSAEDSVVIGQDGAVASAKLAVTSTTQGILFPRMTTIQKNTIVAPDNGLVVYDTTLNKLCVRANGAWETITSVP